MNKKLTLLLLSGLASSAVMAQSQNSPQIPQPQIQPAGRQSADQSLTPGSAAQPSGNFASQAQQQGSLSSGASSTEQSENENTMLPPAPESVTALEPRTENGVTYLCGGVGVNESAQMKQEARDYDLMLTFATRRGNYLADVNVNIADARGNQILKTKCDAPIMLIDFPKSGTYHVRAETGGYTLNKTAQVNAKGRSHSALVMLWPQQLAEAAPEPGATSSGGNNSSMGNGSSSGNENSDADAIPRPSNEKDDARR